MSLFVKQDFIGHSGGQLHWKIECDALTDDDWACLALMVSEQRLLDRYSEIIGIPRGGLKFEAALRELWSPLTVGMGPRLFVDDVCTTGRSLREAMTRDDDIGLVVFARGPLPPRVTALFAMPDVVKGLGRKSAAGEAASMRRTAGL